MAFFWDVLVLFVGAHLCGSSFMYFVLLNHIIVLYGDCNRYYLTPFDFLFRYR